MGVFRSVPVTPTAFPFLYNVDFETFAKELAKLRKGMALRSQAREAASELTATAVNGELDDLIDRFPNIIGLQPALEILRQDLGTSSVFITGPRESGKTTLVEEYLRMRAEGRLSSLMGTKPFYIFDAVGFFTTRLQPGEDRAEKFNQALDFIASGNGMLIMDHIDDFKSIAEKEGKATLLLNILVTTIEKNRRRGMRAIVVAEESNAKGVYEAADSMDRAFTRFQFDKEPTFDQLKPILISAAVRMEVNHVLHYSEEAIDEAIRLLARYPGRAFTESRPGNAINFLNLVGSHVRRNLYAEPPKVTELREELKGLQDRYEILSVNSDSDTLTKMCEDIAKLSQEFHESEDAWRKKFSPLFEAQDTLREIERNLPILRAKRARTPDEEAHYQDLKGRTNRSTTENDELKNLSKIEPRTPAEEQAFSSYVKLYSKAQQEVVDAEKALYPELPTVTAEHVRAVFNQHAGISVKSPAETRRRTRNTEAYLKTQVFGQDPAAHVLAEAYNARENGTKNPSKPTVLLFAGGSGLGKTEITTALERWDLGLEDRPDLADQIEPIVLSLSEYGDATSTSKLLGANPGYAGYGEIIQWHEDVRKNPRGILLLDEGDKAHPKIFLTLMQGFDKGLFKDSSGKPVNLKDLIIVVCINGITADDIPDEMKGDKGFIFQKICDVQSEAGGNLFTSAIVNRFSAIEIFNNLSYQTLANILHKKEIRKLNDDFHDKGVTINLDAETALAIVTAYPISGAGGRAPGKIVDLYIRPVVNSFVNDRDEKLDEKGQSATHCKNRLTIQFDGKNINLVPADEPKPIPVSAKPLEVQKQDPHPQ